MTELQNFEYVGIALAIGLLIGLERGWHARMRSEGMRIAGFRTYGLIATLGCLLGLISKQTSIVLIGIAFLALSVILLAAYSKSLSKIEDYSITSMMAALICFTLGMLTAFGHATLASATAVLITLLLGFKPVLHGWINKLEQHELEATLKLLLISVVMLPILPNRGMGPWNVFNPFLIWWLVVLIAGISYLGYFAIRIVGNRHGPVLTGVLGGLVSSTAVTINLARLSKNEATMQKSLAAGILTACGTMFVRSLVLVSIVSPALLAALLPVLAVMSIVTYFPAFILWKSMSEFREDDSFSLENPFQLGMAMKFGAFLVAVLFLSRLLNDYYGDTGAYILAAISGMADVDPIILSMAQLSGNSLELEVAAKAILIAVSVNTLIKGSLACFLGGRLLGYIVLGILTLAVTAGLAIAFY